MLKSLFFFLFLWHHWLICPPKSCIPTKLINTLIFWVSRHSLNRIDDIKSILLCFQDESLSLLRVPKYFCKSISNKM